MSSEPRNILAVKCPNDVCIETFQIPEPKPQGLNSTYFCGITFPTVIMRCRVCGTVIQMMIKSWQVDVEWQAASIGKVEPGPKIVVPS